MDYQAIEQDLKFIRKTMESSTRYTNIPALGYFGAGSLAILGSSLTFAIIGPERLAGMGEWRAADGIAFLAIWVIVLFAALTCSIYLQIHRARKYGIAAWNALSERMFLSQIPIAILAGIVTLAAVFRGAYLLIPGLWLLSYGVITIAFSYFTGIEHKILGILFLILGVAALFVDPTKAVLLLAAGFGILHFIVGLVQWTKNQSLL